MCEMKQKWEAIDAQIESVKESLSKIENATRLIRINCDHDWSRDRFVEEYIANGGELPYEAENEDDYWEGVNFVAQCIASDVWQDMDEYDREDEAEEDWFEWFTEVVTYNVRYATLARIVERLEGEIEALESKQDELLDEYRGEYENACDDLYYGYGFDFWYNGEDGSVAHKDYFPDEETAKFVWRLAFTEMAEAD